ncbi:hypothetical protein WJX72_009167 [[Myrmecia] bisecta]|uniref:Serine/threonine-protein kinase RIO2 n=1 Tax=[Myrmecia] bisecta TaxID=41462 RepID=A0AAW1PXA8_9CHLO
MKLDVNALRYMSKEEFRTLVAVEIGQKNHEIVPVTLIDTIAGLKHGGTMRYLRTLLRYKLVHHDNSKYDGYRLTYLGYDFLAIKTMVNRGTVSSVGRQIGVGKESDVFEVMDEGGRVMALKLHRLGRTSFRAVKSKRDYLRNRSSFSWLYLSRLAALKEYAFMTALGKHGLPVPEAIDHNRHAVLMSLVDACPLVQVRELVNPGVVYRGLMELMVRLTELGLIHCDFNEFNLLVDDDEKLTLIDFPQMVSTSHSNAEELFERDVDCIIRFFKKKLGYIPEHDDTLPYLRPDFKAVVARSSGTLDVELAASGFQKQHQDVLERFARPGRDGDAGASGDEADDAGHNAAELKMQPPTPIQGHDEPANEGSGGAAQAHADGSDDEAGLASFAAQEQAVHQRVVQQQKKVGMRKAVSRATRNAQKSSSHKGRKQTASSIDW